MVVKSIQKPQYTMDLEVTNMKKLISILFIILFGAVGFVNAQSQQLPFLEGTEVQPKIELGSNGLYQYSYALKNGSQSSGDIFSFEIDIKRGPSKVSYDTTGLIFKNQSLRQRFERLYSTLADSIVPVGFLNVPTWWIAGLTVDKTASFGGSIINPGETQSGFVLNSKGLPGIRSYVLSPNYDPSEYYPSVGDLDSIEEVKRIDSLINRDRRKLPVRGKTIGPIAPPENLLPDDFADTLSSYLTFSCDTTWISNQGICRSLEAKLENVQRQLDRGNTNAASGSLEAFINEVEAQKDKQLSSEAYALLYFNGQYLLEKLNK